MKHPDFGEGEITVSKNEFAEVISDVVAKLMVGIDDESRNDFSILMATFCALLMIELFDADRNIEIDE